MKRIVLVLLVMIVMTSCSSSLKEENESLKARLAEVESEYSEYQQVMQEYDGLAKSELEVRKYQAEQQKAYIKAVEESKAIEESIKAEVEEKKGYDTGITFFNLERMPENFKGQKVKFYGRVIQVLEGDKEVDIRLATKKFEWTSSYANKYSSDTDYMEDIIMGYYNPKVASYRVLEGDMITIYGVSQGLYTYTAKNDEKVTLPLIEIEKIDQKAY